VTFIAGIGDLDDFGSHCLLCVTFIAGIGDLDDFGSLSTVPTTVKVTTSKKVTDKPRITVM